MTSSGWGISTALSDWGIGGASPPEEESAGGAATETPTRMETTPASDAEVDAMTKTLDAEVDAMTKKMETGVTTALASFGFGGSTKRDIPEPDGEERKAAGVDEDGAPKIETTPASDEELAAMTKEMESGLTAALAGFGFGDSGNKCDRASMEDEPAGENESVVQKSEVESAAEAASSAIWSTFETVSELKAPSSVIGEWIDDLQKENDQKDPHKGLRDSLDEFLKERPCAKYEEWVEHLLISEGWDEDSAVVDDSFYWEKSSHRNVWNERNIIDGIKVDEAETKRAYVAARDSKEIAAKSAVSDGNEEEVVFE